MNKDKLDVLFTDDTILLGCTLSKVGTDVNCFKFEKQGNQYVCGFGLVKKIVFEGELNRDKF